jgi:hypothetical protein
MNNAQIDAQANNSANAGKVYSTLKAIIPSQNQLEVYGKPATGSEPNATHANVIKAAKSGWSTPQLNLSGSINALNRNTLAVPDLHKGNCERKEQGSVLSRTSKGGLPRTEVQFVFIPPATMSETKQIKAVITPHDLTTENSPCAPLSF